jgi:hypothetical protein
MKLKSFRYCMLVAAASLVGVAVFYLSYYAIIISVALDNSGIKPFIADSMRAMWLAFACQSLLIGLLYALVAFRPRAVSREVIVLLGLLQLVEAVLLLTFAGSKTAALLLAATATFVLIGAALWPKVQPAAGTSGADWT